MRVPRLWLATVLPLAMATAQPGPPKDVTLTVSAPKSVFYMGEIIPLQLSFTAREPEKYNAESRLQDRVGRMNYVESFKVDPADGTEDPLRGLQGEDGGMGGLSGGPVTLSAKPFTLERDLNEWVRFTRPGTYRVTVVSHRVTLVGEPRRPLEVTSNALTIEILPAPAEWVKEQIAGAVKVLDTANATAEERLRASRALRFLYTPEAAAAALLHLDENAYDLHAAVLGAPNRGQLLALMERRLVAPNQPIGYRYLYTLSNLAELVASGGVMAPVPKQPDQLPVWREESGRRFALQQEKRNQYTARLAASLSAKQPEARAVSFDTLLNLAPLADPAPAWLRSAVESLVRDFQLLPVRTQSLLLESHWNLLKGPAMLPVLRDLYAHPPDRVNGLDLAPVVVRRLSDLAPDEGRRILLDEIRHPKTWLPFELLASLPDRTLPEMDEALAERLDDRLIVRYATGAIVKRVEQAYEKRAADFDRQKLPHCATPLAFYFLQHDPEYGERELRRSLSPEGGNLACYDFGRNFPGPWAMSPALESLAIEMLSSPAVPIKNGAATILGKYGSPAAQEPLWRTLEFFRSWWKDREADLQGAAGAEGRGFERTLRIALAQGNAWLLRDAGLTRLQSICSSAWCRQEVGTWLQAAKSPVQIDIVGNGESLRFSVAQYEAAPEDDLRRRLAQFPPNTEFHLQPPAGAARERLRELVIAAGHVPK